MNKIIKIVILVISVSTMINSQNVLYDGGDFTSSLFTTMSIPTSPYTLDQVNAILSSAPIANVTGSIINDVPCVFISKGQNVGYRLVTTQLTGYAFLASNNLCPCNACFRVTSCCGPIRNSDGTVTPCYSPIPCQGNGTCLRNYECYGISDTVSHVSLTTDLNAYINSIASVPLNTPCFKISPTLTTGYTFKTITSGTGFYATSCNSTSTTTTTACLKLQPCCAGQGRACYTATPCCVQDGTTQARNCLSITSCDIPN